MANSIRYATYSIANTIRQGNIAVGTNLGGYGTTTDTGFWSGINPPAGGYTIYMSRSGGTASGFTIYTPGSDSDLISFVNTINSSTYSTIEEALQWAYLDDDKIIANMEYPNIVLDNLVFHIDPGFSLSYPRTGLTMSDVTWNTHNATISGYPVYGTTYGCVTLNGTIDYLVVGNTSSLNTTTFSFCTYIKNDRAALSWDRIISKKADYTDSDGYEITLGTGTSSNIYVRGSNGVSNYVNSGLTIANGDWFHLGVSVAGTSASVYINSVNKGSISIATIVTNTNDLLIGKILNETTSLFSGSIGPFSYYNDVLTSAEMYQNYLAFNSRFSS